MHVHIQCIIVHTACADYKSLFILLLAHSKAYWLSLISDLLICCWVTLALKCPLVIAILSVMSRKDEGLWTPLPLSTTLP